MANRDFYIPDKTKNSMQKTLTSMTTELRARDTAIKSLTQELTTLKKKKQTIKSYSRTLFSGQKSIMDIDELWMKRMCFKCKKPFQPGYGRVCSKKHFDVNNTEEEDENKWQWQLLLFSQNS